MATEPNLRQGMRGAAVVTLQRLLHISDDGVFGPGTEEAVKVFQAQHGLTSDGVVGPATWAKLLTSGSTGFTGAKGVDVSRWQGNIDFGRLHAAGIQFAYAKASEGSGYVDPDFSQYVEEARAHGVLIGAYHFARPDQNSAQAEAEHFLRTIQGRHLDLLPVLDLEEPQQEGKMSGAQILAWAREWIDLVEKGTGQRVVVYTGVWFIEQYGLTALEDYLLWLAVYSTSAPSIHCDIWQYTEKGSLPGISGSVDRDVMHSSFDITALRWKYPEPSKPNPPAPKVEPKPEPPKAPASAPSTPVQQPPKQALESWKQQAVQWLAQRGYTSKIQDPDQPVTYAELGIILQKYRPQ